MRVFERDHGVPVPNFATHLHFDAQTNHRRYNIMSNGEIVGLLLEGEEILKNMRDVVLHFRGDGYNLEYINKCHLTYLPLHYVLFFPYGELGWHCEL